MEWISVNDRLPEMTIHCIVYGRYAKDTPKRVMGALYDPRRKQFHTDIITKDVTHWMPMPAPPKQ